MAWQHLRANAPANNGARMARSSGAARMVFSASARVLADNAPHRGALARVIVLPMPLLVCCLRAPIQHQRRHGRACVLTWLLYQTTSSLDGVDVDRLAVAPRFRMQASAALRTRGCSFIACASRTSFNVLQPLSMVCVFRAVAPRAVARAASSRQYLARHLFSACAGTCAAVA